MRSVPDNFADKNICIIGLGYVGLTLSTVMAETGFSVTSIEIRDEVLDSLNKREPHFFEPGLKERLAKIIDDGSMKFYKTIPDDIRATVYIITVGTPLGKDGKVRLDMIETVTREIAKHMHDGDMVVMRSTVSLGTTVKIVIPILQKTGLNFDVAFCPERTVEGKALTELRQLPQIVGGNSLNAAIRAGQMFQFLTPTVVRVSDLETAELIKLVDNVYRDALFAFSNEVARICNAVGVSATEVIDAGKLGYPRVNMPMPGPVGGPCLGKDTYLLAEGLTPYGIVPEITMASRRANENQPREVVEYLSGLVTSFRGWPEKPVITILGLAFKGRPLTDDLRGTMAKPLFDTLKEFFPNATFRGYDALVSAEKIRDFGVKPYPTLEEAIQGAHLVFIQNNHPVFSDMPIEKRASLLGRPGLFYDFWNHFIADDLKLPKGTGYMAFGSHGKAKLPE